MSDLLLSRHARRRLPPDLGWTPRRQHRLVAVVLTAVVVTVGGCGTTGKQGTTLPTTGAATGRTVLPDDAAGSSAGAGGATGSTARSTIDSTSTGKGCSLNTILAISGESGSIDAARTSSWTLLRANGWTVAAPNGAWHLSASAGGADVLSPDGGSDASLANWPSLTAWTYSSLAAKILGGVSNIKVICQTPNEQGSTASSQATEFTGDYRGAPVHIVIDLSLIAPTTPGLFVGQTRSIYTPVSQWSTSAEQDLWLIVKRAILSPQAPGG